MLVRAVDPTAIAKGPEQETRRFSRRGVQAPTSMDVSMPNSETRRRVRRGRIDIASLTVTLSAENAGTRYECNVLPPPVQTYLTLLGLKSALLATKTPDLSFAALAAGEIPEQPLSGSPRQSKWREAIALTLAMSRAQFSAPKGAKKAEIERLAQEDMPRMRRHVSTLNHQTFRQLKERHDVREYHRKLYGTKTADKQMDILAMAGVLDPLTLENSTDGAPSDGHEPGSEQAAA